MDLTGGPGPRALRRWAVASLVANIGIVVTGGLVRLTGRDSAAQPGRDVPTTRSSPIPSSGVHGAIEFGNRLLTFVLIIIALLTFVSALLYRDAPDAGGRRRDLRWLAAALALGIPAQGVSAASPCSPAQPVPGRRCTCCCR